MPEPTRHRARRAAVAAAISAAIIGTAVALAFLAGGGGTPGGTGGPGAIQYVDYRSADDLLAAHAGRPLVVNFFASWCAPCRAELPDLAAASAAYGAEVDFVGVNYQEASPSAAAALLAEAGITYPIAEDPEGTLLRDLGTLPTMPTTVFVTAGGVVVERHHGLILSEQLTERIEEIIAAS